ncbi:MAG: YdcF family protein [Cyanobacteria bacterium P01_F01_bin.53]
MLSTLLTPLVLVGGISLRLAIARHRAPTPQAILTLGGGIEREKLTAQLAIEHPTLDILISSGSPPQQIIEVFTVAKAPTEQLHLDSQATDTVTNFTTTVNKLQQKNIEHIYLVTSDFHMRRAEAIAFWVLGSRSIAYTPIKVPSENVPIRRQPESTLRTIRDIIHSLLWITTGKTGAHFGQALKHQPEKSELTISFWITG